jgi:hypothetical protein
VQVIFFAILKAGTIVELIFLNGGILFDMNEEQVAIDNFKLWDLSGE